MIKYEMKYYDSRSLREFYDPDEGLIEAFVWSYLLGIVSRVGLELKIENQSVDTLGELEEGFFNFNLLSGARSQATFR